MSAAEAEVVAAVVEPGVVELELELAALMALPMTCTATSSPPGCDRAPLERAEDTPLVTFPSVEVEDPPPLPLPLVEEEEVLEYCAIMSSMDTGAEVVVDLP